MTQQARHFGGVLHQISAYLHARLSDVRWTLQGLRPLRRELSANKYSLVLQLLIATVVLLNIGRDAVPLLRDILEHDEGWERPYQVYAAKAVGLFAGLVVLGYLIHFWRQLRKVFMWKATRLAAKNIKTHFRRAVRYSLPRGGVHNRWADLTSAALAGLSHSDELQAHFVEGPESPLLCCNFRSYARAVAGVLQKLHAMEDGSRKARVWTVFKRPIINWFNPFSLTLAATGQGLVQIRVSTDWWEDYKKMTVRIVRDHVVQLRRLVAHPEFPNNHNPKTVYLGSPLHQPLDLRTARETVSAQRELCHDSLRGITLIDIEHLKNLLFKVNVMTRESRGTANLVETFHNDYHPHRLNDPERPGAGGGFYRYIKKKQDAEELLVYDDLFVVEFFDDGDEQEQIPTLSFGLAFISSELHDQNGMWLMRHADLQYVLGHLRKVWEVSSPDFAPCRGLSAEGTIYAS